MGSQQKVFCDANAEENEEINNRNKFSDDDDIVVIEELIQKQKKYKRKKKKKGPMSNEEAPLKEKCDSTDKCLNCEHCIKKFGNLLPSKWNWKKVEPQVNPVFKPFKRPSDKERLGGPIDSTAQSYDYFIERILGTGCFEFKSVNLIINNFHQFISNFKN